MTSDVKMLQVVLSRRHGGMHGVHMHELCTVGCLRVCPILMGVRPEALQQTQRYAEGTAWTTDLISTAVQRVCGAPKSCLHSVGPALACYGERTCLRGIPRRRANFSAVFSWFATDSGFRSDTECLRTKTQR